MRERDDSPVLTPTDVARELVHIAGSVQNKFISEQEGLRRAEVLPKVVDSRSAGLISVVLWMPSITRDSEFRCLMFSLFLSHIRAYETIDIELWTHVAFDYVKAATQLLGEKLDLNVYRRAASTAAELVDRSRTEHHPTLLVSAGELLLETFALNPADTAYFGNHGERYMRWKREHPFESPRGSDSLMRPSEHLERAERYFREAIPELAGEMRGIASTDLALTLHTLSKAGARRNAQSLSNEISALCNEASSYLPLDGNALACARLAWLSLEYHQVDTYRARIPLRLPEFDHLRDEFGTYSAVVTYATATRALAMAGRINEAYSLISTARSAVEGLSNFEKQHLFFSVNEIHCIPDDPTECQDHVGPRSAVALRKQQNASAKAQLASSIHELLHTDEVQRSDFNRLLGDQSLGDLERYLRLAYTARVAMRARLPGPGATKVPDLIEASLLLFKENFCWEATYLLEILLHLLRTETDAARYIEYAQARSIIMLADLVFGWLDEQDAALARDLLITLLGLIGIDSAKLDDILMMFLMQVAKGRAFGARLASGQPIGRTEYQLYLLETGAHASIPSTHNHLALPSWGNYDPEGWLSAYLGPGEAESGSTRESESNNVRRAFQRESALMGRLGIRRFGRVRTMLGTQERLEANSALLSIIDGAVGEELADGYWAILITRNHKRVTAHFNPRVPAFEGMAMIEADGSTFRLSPLGYRIASLRRALIDEPLHRTVTLEGRLEIEQLATYLRPALDSLDKLLDSGISKLYIWPHESLFLAPFALLPFRRGLLSDYVQLATIPSVENFFRARESVRESSFAVVGFGDGGVELGLRPEPAIELQVGEVASTVGVEPILADEATPARVLLELRRQKYVHIAAHGAQDLAAPDFSCIYLSSADGSNGCLYAHDVFELDLSDVELVSLSACESALVRYDVSDNIYGLVSAFLGAGVRSVIGALWPVDPGVARVFFIELYRRVLDGDRLSACFAIAQAEARRLHPEYRDWGAFILFGS